MNIRLRWLVPPFAAALGISWFVTGLGPRAPIGVKKSAAATVAPPTAALAATTTAPTAPSAGMLVTVDNPLPEARPSETVSIGIGEMQRRMPGVEPKAIAVTDAVGVPLLSQWVDADGDEKPDALVFQMNLGPSESRVALVKPGSFRAAPDRDQFRVYGRFVRERHEDFAWENDRVAHRMYGRALETWKAEPLTSSGIDVWCKRVRRLVVNDWYLTDTYHQDSGEGGDFYSVKGSRGCGGLGVWSAAQKQLAVSRNFVNSRVLANGPIRLIFELTYAPWDVGAGQDLKGAKVSEVKRVTLDAGSNFGRYESTFRLEGARGVTVPVGIGIARHEGGVFDVNKAAGWQRSWEPLNKGKTPNPQSVGCAVLLPGGPVLDAPQTDTDQLLVVNARTDSPYGYFAGSGWDGSGDFADRAAWNKHVDAFARRVANPVRVVFSATPTTAPTNRATLTAAAAGRTQTQLTTNASTWARRACDSVMVRSATLTERWHYEPGLLLKACLDLWAQTQDPKLLAYARQSVDRVIDAEGNIRGGFKIEDYNLDNINMGKVLFPLLAIARRAGDAPTVARYTKALQTLRGQLRNQPRTRDGGFWHKLIYPRQMWLDGLYMASPFLAEYAAVFHEPELLDDAVQQVLLAEEHMRDPRTGLLFHGWDEMKQQGWANPKTGTSPEFWGRAMGWYAMAIVDILDHVPVVAAGGGSDAAAAAGASRARTQRAKLLGVLRRLSESIAKVQDPSAGVWWQVLDGERRPPNYQEASASAMFVYTLSKALAKGWLDRQRFEPVAAAGFAGIVKTFVDEDASGLVNLRGICKVAGLGGQPYRDGSFAYYTSTEIATNDLKGVGPFILASTLRQ